MQLTKLSKPFHSLAQSYTENIARHYKWLFLLVILLVAISIGLMTQTRINNTIEVFLNQSDPEVRYYYDTFTQQFPSQDIVLITIKSDNLFSLDFYNTLQELTREINQIELVLNTFNLFEKYKSIDLPFIQQLRQRYQETGWFGLINLSFDRSTMFLEDDMAQSSISSQKELDELKEEILSNPMNEAAGLIHYEKEWISQLIVLDGTQKNKHGAVLDQIEAVVNQHFLWEDVRMVGAPVLIDTLTETTFEVLTRFIPFLLILAIILLMLFFRNILLVVLPLTITGVAQILTLGCLSIFFEINFMSSIVPVFVFALSLMNSVYILQEYVYNRNKGIAQHQAVTQSMQEKIIIVFIANATTLISILSLLLSDFQVIAHFSIMIAIAITITFFVSTIFLAVLLYLIKDKKEYRLEPIETTADLSQRNTDQNMDQKSNLNLRFYDKLGLLISRYYLIIIVLFIVPAVFAVFYFNHISIENNILNYFDENSELYLNFKYIDENIGGVSQFDLVVEFDSAMDTNEMIARIQLLGAWEEAIENQPSISHINSLNSLMKESYGLITGEYQVPQRFMYLPLYHQLEDSHRRWISEYVQAEHRVYRMQIFSKLLTYESLMQIKKDVQQALDDLAYPFEVTYRYSGAIYLNTMVTQYFIQSFIESFVFSFLLLLIVVLIFIRDLIMTMAIMFSCSISLLITLLCMILLGFKIDVSTPLLAPLGFGIAVDDALHFIHYYKKHQPMPKMQQIISGVMKRIGRPMLLTSLILLVGLATFGLSSLATTRHIGILSVIIIISAFLSNMVFLPALLKAMKKLKIIRLQEATG